MYFILFQLINIINLCLKLHIVIFIKYPYEKKY